MLNTYAMPLYIHMVGNVVDDSLVEIRTQADENEDTFRTSE
jgi:hypothetical protein